MKVLVLLVVLAGGCWGRMAGVLPGGFRIERGFSCDGRDYGFYADVANGCTAYHLCHPVISDEGQLAEMAHFSFLCGLGTLFDQELLSCAHARHAFPCGLAESIYEPSNYRLRDDAANYDAANRV